MCRIPENIVTDTLSYFSLFALRQVLNCTLLHCAQSGIGGSGKGHGQLALLDSMKYYISVRALTGAGSVLESSSDGVVVDVTPPAVVIRSVGTVPLNSSGGASVVYRGDTDWVTATWYTSDPQSGVGDMWLHQGTYPGMAV